MGSSLRDRLAAVKLRVARSAERAGRSPSEVQIVAVSKTVSAAVVAEAYHLGQLDFGENRVQEAREKRHELAALPMGGARWHLVGHLQSNKARLAVELFGIIQSVDSVKLARRLNEHAGALGKRPGVLLQVDYSLAPQRSGFDPAELMSALDDLASLTHLEIQGLMTVAPLGLEGDDLRAVFRRLRRQRDELAARCPAVDWCHLSMGMSEDFEVAIEEGATIVRIGRAIFGERPVV